MKKLEIRLKLSDSKKSFTQLESRVISLRLLQLELNEKLKEKKFKVPVHLGLGTEAAVIAISSIIRDGDNLLLTHRNSAFNLAMAEDPASVFLEYKGSELGLASGRLGSMNLVNLSAGIVYSSSILANNISVACGFAYGQKIKGLENLTIVLTGDGGIEEGAFYEGLVFAKSHNLRLLVVVDNNNYSMASQISERRCSIDLSAICESVDIEYLFLNGNDVNSYAQQMALVKAQQQISADPCVVEVNTSLLNQHSGPTPGWPGDSMQVDIKNGLIIKNDLSDPLFVIAERLGRDKFDLFETQLLSKRERALDHE